MIDIWTICQWLKMATKDQKIKVWVDAGYCFIETETRVYRLSIDRGIL